jgi:hypothetical protein
MQRARTSVGHTFIRITGEGSTTTHADLVSIMRKNKDIFLHIIDEDYLRHKQNQRVRFDVTDKALELTDQANASVIERLKEMHRDLEEDPATIDESEQAKQQNSDELMYTYDISELYSHYQEIKDEGQELEFKKQELLLLENDLREKMIAEIAKKKETNQTLRSKIFSLQNICDEISQELQSTAKYPNEKRKPQSSIR